MRVAIWLIFACVVDDILWVELKLGLCDKMEMGSQKQKRHTKVQPVSGNLM